MWLFILKYKIHSYHCKLISIESFWLTPKQKAKLAKLELEDKGNG